jgi:hypothetical protein
MYESYFEQNDDSKHNLKPTTVFPNASSKYKSLFKNGF